MALRRNRRAAMDHWPGFVDALSTLLILIIFVLMVFVIAQFFLGQAISGRDAALDRLNREVAELADLLNLERLANEDLRRDVSALSSQLAVANQRAEDLGESTRETTALLADIAALEALRDELERQITERDRLLAEGDGQLQEQTRLSEQARAQAALLQQQLEALRLEMARLAEALDAAEELNRNQEVQIADLGRQLNRALATRLQELQRYRSEFFGRLREVLGDRADIRVEGDRFVFQSEVLFASASASLEEEGQEQMAHLAQALLEIAATIPPEINWILRVDGHTDRRPIATAQFRSNWELSAARAISVVNFLISQGIPPERLVAAGFGEFQPLDEGTSEDSLRRNRRIELKLDSR